MTAPRQFEDDHHVTRKIDWSLWRRILTNMRPYPVQIVLMALSGTLLAASEITLPLLTAAIVDQAIAGESSTAMWWYAAAYLGILMFFAGVVWVFINTAGRLATGVAFDVRAKAFARLQTLPFSYYDRRSSGWLVSRVTSDVTKVTGLLLSTVTHINATRCADYPHAPWHPPACPATILCGPPA